MRARRTKCERKNSWINGRLEQSRDGAAIRPRKVPAASEENALQEVVVTATRREMSAQEIPISITAVTGASLVVIFPASVPRNQRPTFH